MPHRIIRVVVVAVFTLTVMSVALAMRTAEQVPVEPKAAAGEPPVPPSARAAPRYWKGNLHTHSLWSDGDDFPDMIADWYASRGYNFLTLSEHNVIAEGERWIDLDGPASRKVALEKYLKRFGTSWVEQREVAGKKQVRLKPLREFRTHFDSPGKFTMIQGEEVTYSFGKKPTHINAINLRDALKPIDGKDVAETIRVNIKQIADQQKKSAWPGLTFLNHPNFHWGVTVEDMIAAEDLRCFEVFNGHPSVHNYGDATRASTERIWDILLAVRLGKLDLPLVYGVATDDAHAYHTFSIGKVNPGRGWVQVRATHLTPDSIIRAMTAGDFYSSSGVTLTDVSQKPGEYGIVIAAEPGVTYKTEYIATMAGVNLTGEAMMDAEGKALPITRRYSADIGKVVATSTETTSVYKFTGKELYVRARITSSKPHPNPYAKGDFEMAWTQPVRP